MRSCQAILLILALLGIHPAFTAQGYSIQFMCEEDATTSPSFSIVRVAPFDGGLRLFLDTGHPDTVAGLLAAGALEAQLSDQEAETATSVSISLGKAVRCTNDGPVFYLGYADPLPKCDGNPPVTIEYFFAVPVTLGPSRDLAIGQEPDFLWLIEEIEGNADHSKKG